MTGYQSLLDSPFGPLKVQVPPGNQSRLVSVYGQFSFDGYIFEIENWPALAAQAGLSCDRGVRCSLYLKSGQMWVRKDGVHLARAQVVEVRTRRKIVLCTSQTERRWKRR